MDLGKPISGLPKPFPPHALNAAIEPLPVDAVEQPARTVKIAMPAYWKLSQAGRFFFICTFPAMMAMGRGPSTRWLLAGIGAAFLVAVGRVCTSSISGTSQRLVVPAASGLLRRTLPAVTSVSIAHQYHPRSGLWVLSFHSVAADTRPLMIPMLRWQLTHPSPGERATDNQQWIGRAAAALGAAGIPTDYSDV